MAILLQTLQFLIACYTAAIVVRAALSWFPADSDNPLLRRVLDPRNPVARFLRRITDPMLDAIRARMPGTGPVDLSPLVAFLILIVLSQVIHRIYEAMP